MRLFPPPLVIGPDEGFTAAKDIFNRRRVGDGLTSLVTAVSDPLVLAINGQWGTGKSTFLKMWAGELRKAKFPVIYFDAFAHDYISDAFGALAGEVIDIAKKAGPEAKANIKQAAISAGKVLIKVGTSFGVRVATAGLLSGDDLKDVVDDAKDAVGDAADKIIDEALEDRNKEREALEAFRKALSSLPSLLEKDNKPLIFMIDELDRCKPTFALELLERVKHFFSVPHVHFVLGVHMEQLENSVKATYGGEVNTAMYLQKFISLAVNLDNPTEKLRDSVALRYVNYLKSAMEFADDKNQTVKYTTDFISRFALHRGISLRSIEKIMTTLAVALAYTRDDELRLAPILAGLCAMKVLATDLYAKARQRTLRYNDVHHFFDLGSDASDREWPNKNFVKWWQYGLDGGLPADEVAQLDKALFNFSGADREHLIEFTANDIIERLVQPEPPYS